MMKKLFAILMASILLMTGCVACGQAEEDSSAPVSSDEGTGNAVSTTTAGDGGSTTDTAAQDNSTTAAEDTTAGSQTTGTTTAVQGADKTTSATKGATTMVTTKAVTTTTAPAASAVPYDYTKYNLDGWLQPVWEGNIVYNETIMFVPDATTKKIEPAPLLYTPTEIISVRSFDLKTEYVEGVDYTVQNGCIVLTTNTRIPTWKLTEYYRMTADVYDLPSISMPGHHLKYGDASLLQKQICVTYRHNGKWEGYVPTYQGDKLPKTMEKLKNNSGLTIVYNGDSIMEGCDASGKLGVAPFMPTWQNMLTDKLKQTYGNNITAINTAVGGTTSAWGKNNVQNNIIQHSPDLVILRFGTNDGTAGMSVAEYTANMEQIIIRTRKKLPNCEFLIITSTLPNPDAKGWTTAMHSEYPKVVESLAAKYEGIAVVKMFEMQEYVLTKKRYWDTTVNNINHPSDFFLRIKGQAVAQALIPDLTK